MRLAITAVISFGLLASALQPAVSQPASPPAQVGDPSTTGQSDAAEKHVKRTACLKNAKTKKLMGADKTSFLKTCIAAP